MTSRDGASKTADDLLELIITARRPAWHADVACREHSEVTFFPERGEPAAPARTICEECLVKAECAEAGQLEDHGIWGGTSARERQRARTSARRSTA